MKKISFLEDAIPALLSGKKTQTIRLGENFVIGETVELVSQTGESLGFLKIKAKETISLRDLNIEDAKAHGWASVEELITRIRRIYPNKEESTKYSKYKFTFRNSS